MPLLARCSFTLSEKQACADAAQRRGRKNVEDANKAHHYYLLFNQLSSSANMRSAKMLWP